MRSDSNPLKDRYMCQLVTLCHPGLTYPLALSSERHKNARMSEIKNVSYRLDLDGIGQF